MCGTIVIFGCGGHARSVLGVLEECKIDRNIIFVDENAQSNETIDNYRVVSNYKMKQDDYFHVAIGDNRKREKMFRKLLNDNVGKPLSIISQFAQIRNNATIGQGVFISAFAYIGPEAVIGENSIINTASVVEHEVSIGSHCHIAPNATVCGRASIKNSVMIGAGATVIDKIQIEENIMVGAGATVICDLKKEGCYVGVPARRIGEIK